MSKKKKTILRDLTLTSFLLSKKDRERLVRIMEEKEMSMGQAIRYAIREVADMGDMDRSEAPNGR